METKNPPIVYRMCSLLAALPLLLCISLCSRCYCLCLFFYDVWWMYEGGREDTCLLHAGSGWRVKDANVRHRQIWWRLMAVYSSVCAIDKWEAHATEPSNTVIFIMIFWELSCQMQQRKKNWSRMRENDMLCVLGHHRGKLFLRQHYSSVNLGFLFKMDHTANMKYTLCIEHLIKYWLQTYMNLPHQIEPPVGGLALIRCIWYGNESRKQKGPFPVLLIYLFYCQVPNEITYPYFYRSYAWFLCNISFICSISLYEKNHIVCLSFQSKMLQNLHRFPAREAKIMLETFCLLMSHIPYASCWTFLSIKMHGNRTMSWFVLLKSPLYTGIFCTAFLM